MNKCLVLLQHASEAKPFVTLVTFIRSVPCVFIQMIFIISFQEEFLATERTNISIIAFFFWFMGFHVCLKGSFGGDGLVAHGTH